MLKSTLFLLCCWQLVAKAASIRQPIMVEIVDTIPKGVWAFFVSNTVGNYDQQYGANGSTLGLSSNFKRNISYNDILQNIENSQERAITRGAFENYGIEDFNSSAGNTDGALELETNITVPILAYGISDRFSIGLAVPVIKVQTAAASGFNASESLQNLTDQIAQEGAPSTAATIQQETDNAINNELAKFNYNQLERNQTIIADLQLWQRYLLHKSANQILTVGNRFSIPVNNSTDLNDIIAMDVNDGQFDITPGIFHSYRIGRSWEMVNSAQYTFQLTGNSVRRVPQSADTPLSSDQERLSFNPGDIAQFQHGHRLWLNPHFNFALAYDLQTKTSDEFRGSQFSAERYQIMSMNTSQKLETMIAGINFNTINLFLANKFPIPMDLNLTYAKPLSGKNVIATELVTLQLGLFYK